MTCSLYGNFRQITFSNLYPDVDKFIADYKSVGITPVISDESATNLYYLLLSRFANSVIASSDTNRFKYDLFGTIFSYGPTWESRLKIQEKIRNLTDEELKTGGVAIFNHAMHPGTAPSTQTLEELPAVNEQQVRKSKRSMIDALSIQYELLATDVTENFLSKFKKLFLVIVMPERPLFYVTDETDEEDL